MHITHTVFSLQQSEPIQFHILMLLCYSTVYDSRDMVVVTPIARNETSICTRQFVTIWHWHWHWHGHMTFSVSVPKLKMDSSCLCLYWENPCGIRHSEYFKTTQNRWNCYFLFDLVCFSTKSKSESNGIGFIDLTVKIRQIESVQAHWTPAIATACLRWFHCCSIKLSGIKSAELIARSKIKQTMKNECQHSRFHASGYAIIQLQ